MNRNRLEDLGRVAELANAALEDSREFHTPRWKDLDFPEGFSEGLEEMLGQVWSNREQLIERMAEIYQIARWGDDEEGS